MSGAPSLQARLEAQSRRAKIKRLMDIAVKYGVVRKGWTANDYMRESFANYGWESTAITGPKGSAKSNLLLQRGYSIYENWDEVLRHTITTREAFMDLLEKAIEGNERIPWVGVDDIATIFPRSLYFTDRKLYSELKSSWETMRTVMSNFDFTATRKNKVSTFITEDITGDIITYNRKGEIIAHYDYRRWLWLRNLKDPTEMVAKLIAIEDIPFPLLPDSFKLDKVLRDGGFIVGGVVYHGERFFKEKARLIGVPRPVFVTYWNNRLSLASTAYHRFKRILEATKRKESKEDNPPMSPNERAKRGAQARWNKEKT
jgi:hypothetical protein